MIAVARLVEKKGLKFLIEAASQLELDALVIVGDGPLRPELEQLARELSVEDVVHFKGAQPAGAIRELMVGCDLLAAPSIVARDGDRDLSPTVVKEALAMGLPVVASDAVGLPELIRPEWGRLVPPGDSRALAQSLDEVLSLDMDQRAAMGEAGRAWVERECNAAINAGRLLELIKEPDRR